MVNERTNNKTDISKKVYKLGRTIFQHRRERGMSQNVFAEKIGISREHLAKIETAKRTLSFDLLIVIAKELNVHVKDLIDF